MRRQPPQTTLLAFEHLEYLTYHRRYTSNEDELNELRKRREFFERVRRVYDRAVKENEKSKHTGFSSVVSSHALRLMLAAYSSSSLSQSRQAMSRFDLAMVVDTLAAVNALEIRRRAKVSEARVWLSENDALFPVAYTHPHAGNRQPALRPFHSPHAVRAINKAFSRINSLADASEGRLERRFENISIALRKWIFAIKLLSRACDTAALQVLYNRLFSNPPKKNPRPFALSAADTIPVNSRELIDIAIKYLDLFSTKQECLSWITRATSTNNQEPCFELPSTFVETTCPWLSVLEWIQAFVFNDYDFGKDLDSCLEILQKAKTAILSAQRTYVVRNSGMKLSESASVSAFFIPEFVSDSESEPVANSQQSESKTIDKPVSQSIANLAVSEYIANSDNDDSGDESVRKSESVIVISDEEDDKTDKNYSLSYIKAYNNNETERNNREVHNKAKSTLINDDDGGIFDSDENDKQINHSVEIKKTRVVYESKTLAQPVQSNGSMPSVQSSLGVKNSRKRTLPFY
ncbi:hypothetical protein HK100_000452 [Physocladia obscura]|uniref:Uncharacterized protein n=1 Tax=Physocladia obscura TaxID=109957 RepID=A0AAD5XGY1_9FUNG|nr:hypothetical protein HK100_000452 [Physocladia obscura]